MPKRSIEAKNLDDNEQKIYENLTQLNNSRQKSIANSKQKSIANSKQKSTAKSSREEHSQEQGKINRTDRAVPTAVRDVWSRTISRREKLDR